MERRKMDKETKRPQWLKEGVISAGKWECLTERRRGGPRENEEEIYEREHSEETVKRLSEIGVTLVISQFHKGFGFKAEKEDME
ncbi:MAG: hypothetical protein KAX20_07325, partial [Candidatus Omnitrophica bacterium]|nr:hypothetical protein [Candidatus Omnitrophota bacterium]